MSREIFDFIIVGSGPAGVSAAFPLVDAGLNVLMVDGGSRNTTTYPTTDFLKARQYDNRQADWMLGANFQALRSNAFASPKLRVPAYSDLLRNFNKTNHIVADNFLSVGSLSSGGLSNMWGGGVASLSDEELSLFPVDSEEMKLSYEAVSKRIGISGGSNDDLTDILGLDEWSLDPIPLDTLHTYILEKYSKQRNLLVSNGFRLGQSRLAVLTSSRKGRDYCNSCGNCLWGCSRQAIYDSNQDLQLLINRVNFNYEPKFVVEQVDSTGTTALIKGYDSQGHRTIYAHRVLLGAGTLASTRLALKALNLRRSVPMQHCPTAAFMLWLPKFLNRQHSRSFGLGQLSFSLRLEKETNIFGSLFSTTGLPVSEFASRLPFTRRYGTDLLVNLLPSCVVGNVFLPGSMSETTLRLNSLNQLEIKGGYSQIVTEVMSTIKWQLRKNFGRLGAMLLPMSFQIGSPGSDIHYAASLPMTKGAKFGATNELGALTGKSRIHIIDGACLPYLPSKSHTLSIMANADRISRRLSVVKDL